MTLEVLWHPPLLAHKASPSTLTLLLTAPATRLSHQCTKWNVLYQETLFLKKSNLQAPSLAFQEPGRGYLIALRQLEFSNWLFHRNVGLVYNWSVIGRQILEDVHITRMLSWEFSLRHPIAQVSS